MQTSDFDRRETCRERELRLLLYDSAVRSLLTMPPGTAFDADRLFRETGVRFAGSRFILAEFEDDPNCPPRPPQNDESISNAERYQNLRDTVLSVFDREHRALVCNRNGRLLLLLNWQAEEKNWHGGFSVLVRNLNARLYAEHGFRFQCTVSQMFNGPGCAEEAWRQLEEVLRYRTLMGGLPGETVFYDGLLHTVNADPNRDAATGESSCDRNLPEALLRGDVPEAKRVFQKILEENFVLSRPGLKFVQLRIFSVIDTLLKSLEQAGDELGMREQVRALDAAPQLLDATDIRELTAAAEQVLDRYQILFDLRQRDVSLPYRIRDCILERRGDSNLNVNLVADQFRITPTYATRVFKQEFGTGILDYIQKVRVDEAARLLDAGKTVGSAAAAVGFGSAEALTRSFKKQRGMTPAQYKNRASSGSGI